MEGHKELFPRLTKHSSISSLNPSRFQVPIFSIGSCNICGSLNHSHDDCPRIHWTLQQHLDFYNESFSYTGKIEEPDFLENAEVSNDFLDNNCSISQSFIIDQSSSSVANISIRHLFKHDDIVSSEIDLDDVLISNLNDLLHENSLALQDYEDDGLSNEDVLEQLTCLLADNPLKSADEFVECDRVGMQELRSTYNNHPVIDLEEISVHPLHAHLDNADKFLMFIVPGRTPMENKERTWSQNSWRSREETTNETKFSNTLTEEGYCRILMNIEISFLWYRDGYSDILAESGCDLKPSASWEATQAFVSLFLFLFYFS